MKHYISALRILATYAVITIHTTGIIIDSEVLYRHQNQIFFPLFKSISEFAVPLFIMISGALLLNPDKNIGYDAIIKKYIPKILWALFIFGLPMCLIEAYMTKTSVGIANVILTGTINFITGNNWSHMWYLYMLLSSYMITPIFKSFVNKASQKELVTCLFFLFIASELLPIINEYVHELHSYMRLPCYLLCTY